MLTGLQIGDAPKETPPASAPEFMVPSPTGGVQVDPEKLAESQAKAPKPNEENKQGETPKPNEENKQGETPKADERPAWLPEKFKTAEEFAKAYGELEKKLGTPKKTPSNVSAAEQAAGLDLNAIEQEWAETDGQLSAATLKTLQDKGLTTETVSQLIAGQQALAARAKAEFSEIAGGDEMLEAVLKWAPTGLTQAEAAAYQNAVTRRDVGTAKLLFESIVARYVAANGKDPKLVTGATIPGAKGVQPYETWDQVHLDMRKQEYRDDPSFRKKVEQRLAVSAL